MSSTTNRAATSSFGKRLLTHRRLTVPDHDEVAKGTLRAIIRQAGVTVEEFKALL